MGLGRTEGMTKIVYEPDAKLVHKVPGGRHAEPASIEDAREYLRTNPELGEAARRAA